MFYSAIIASKGRPAVLAETLASLRRQTLVPREVIVVVTEQADLPHEDLLGPPIRALIGPRGLTRQLNAGIAALDAQCEVAGLFDDDVELAPDYIERAAALFLNRPDITMFDGFFLHPGPCDRETALRMLAEDTERPEAFHPSVHVWGCNMNVRRIAFDHERFDEALASYAWLFEYDFGERVSKLGLCGRNDSCRLVHLAVTGGRIPNFQHGYSQIMNAVYYYKKGTLIHSLRNLFLGHLIKIPTVNLYWLMRGDSRLGRAGRVRRLAGNLRAIAAAACGVSDPRSVEKLR